MGRRRPNPLSPLSIWKLFDNLRRSLVPAALVALLLGGWLWGPGPSWLWGLLVVGVLFLPALLTAAIELVRKPEEWGWPVHLALTGKSAVRPLVRALLALVLLPYDALVYLDAILRSGVRMLFTRRGLLLWHLPSYGRRNARRTPRGFLLEMWIGPVLAVALAVVLVFVPSTRLADWPFVVPVLVLWLVSPLVGWWISRPLRPPAASLSAQQQAFLRALGPADVALLRRFRRSRAQLAAARQLPGVSVSNGRRAHISHEHGNGASGESGRARFRIHLHRRVPAQDRSGPENDGETRALPRPFLQLVRHAHAATAPPAVHLLGR